jgi:hypothetical protein
VAFVLRNLKRSEVDAKASAREAEEDPIVKGFLSAMTTSFPVKNKR